MGLNIQVYKDQLATITVWVKAQHYMCFVGMNNDEHHFTSYLILFTTGYQGFDQHMKGT